MTQEFQNDLNAILSEIEKVTKAWQEKKRNLNLELLGLRGEIERLRAVHHQVLDDNEKEKQSRIESIGKEIDKVRGEIPIAEEKLAGVHDDIASARRVLSALESKWKTLEKSIASLESDIVSKNGEISHLLNRIENLNISARIKEKAISDIADLMERKKAIISEIGDLPKRNAQLDERERDILKKERDLETREKKVSLNEKKIGFFFNKINGVSKS